MGKLFETDKLNLISSVFQSRSLKRKNIQAFCLLQIFLSGIRTNYLNPEFQKNLSSSFWENPILSFFTIMLRYSR